MKLLKFEATWCQPCKALKQNMASLDLTGFEYEAFDVDEKPEMATRYKVRGVPTLIILDDAGNEIARRTGCPSTLQLRAWLDDYL